MAVSDRLIMLENSIFSILSPEGFASILWKDAARWEEAAEVMKLTAQDLYELGICDEVIPEKEGAHQNLRGSVPGGREIPLGQIFPELHS